MTGTANHFEVTLNNWIQNHSNRPLRVGYGTGYSHSWSDRIATYTIGETNGIFSFRGDRVSPFPASTTQTSNIQIRVQTNDNGDTSTGFINFLLRVEPPPAG